MSTLDARKNFAIADLSTGYSGSATSIVLATGKGALYPQPSTDGPFNLVWWNSTDYSDPALDPDREIVRCTARSGDTMTITRAQEGTTATAKNIASKTYSIILGMTAKMITDIETALDALKVDAVYYKGIWNGVGLGYYPGGGAAQKGWVYFCILACTILDDYLSEKPWTGNSLIVANKNNADPHNNNDWDVFIAPNKVSYASVAVTRNATTKLISSVVTNDPLGAGSRSYTINRAANGNISSISTPAGLITITRDADGYYQSSNGI